MLLLLLLGHLDYPHRAEVEVEAAAEAAADPTRRCARTSWTECAADFVFANESVLDAAATATPAATATVASCDFN